MTPNKRKKCVLDDDSQTESSRAHKAKRLNEPRQRSNSIDSPSESEDAFAVGPRSDIPSRTTAPYTRSFLPLKSPHRRSLSVDSVPDSNQRANSIESPSESEDAFAVGPRSDIPSRTTAPYTRSLLPLKSPHRRSLSVDSVSDSNFSNDGGTRYTQAFKPFPIFEGVVITPHSPLDIPADPVYTPFIDEIPETRDLHISGETKPNRWTLPVRLLDHFTVYDENGMYLPFALVAASLISNTSQRQIRASGLVSRCLEDLEDSDSDISEVDTQPLVSLQPLKDFWTDYNTGQLDGVWGARTVGVATKHGWYILRQPAPLYTTYYQPFWSSHHLTWLAAKAIRHDHGLSFKSFCRQMECREDDEAVLILGRNLVKEDITADYVTLYLKDQLSSKKNVHDCTKLLKSPLLRYIVHRADIIGQSLHQFLNLEVFDGAISAQHVAEESVVVPDKALTITMPFVHELTTGLFLKSLLKAGKTLDSHDRGNILIQVPDVPDILHPDRPTNIDWEQPVSGYPDYFSKVYLDGEAYMVGDVVMVNPGKDDQTHRAKSALEACSQSRKNKFVNNVWFCQIIYMFRKTASSKMRTTEPTAHVQWYEHGSRTILQETAHPYGLYSLAECTDIPLGSILGPCVVQHLKPGDEEPNDYHCSFLWDVAEARFLDQAILQQPGHNRGPQCPCCAFNDRRDRDTIHESFIHSETSGEVQGIEYHKDDFVYIAAKPDQPYLIGQIRRFIVDRELTVQNSKVELTLLGRFDDVARAMEGSGARQDEARLFLTEEVKAFSLSLIEGKCFVGSKDLVTSQDLDDHFYVDRWASSLGVRSLQDLSPIEHSKLAVCKSCFRAAKQEQENARAYKTCNAPLKTMELFAGAGGLSTGLEQSKYVQTLWAVEILPGAAATFQANHPAAIVYNQDTNMCLQNAIDARVGKLCEPLRSISDGKELPPMPQRGDVELITGGFPCQSFSAMNHQRHKSHEDIRTTLVANMLSYVEFYEPRYVLMENVKGLLQHHSLRSGSELGGEEDEEDEEDEEGKTVKMSVLKFVLRALLRLGYQTQFKVLQAADYGSPQRRERVIFWAARRSELLPEYPLPTHVASQFRNHVLSLPTHDKLYPVQRSDQNCAPFRALVVADAISDLPGFDWKNPQVICPETDSEVAETKRRRKKYSERSAVSSPLRTLVGFLEPVSYSTSPKTRYQRMLRGNNEQVTLHCSRTFSAPIVERVWHACSHNVNGPHDLPHELWTPALLKVSKDTVQLNTKWQQQFSRLKWKEPFNTALTSCRPFNKGSKVLHPTQKRIITARECARSQGFPDSYEFVQDTKDEDGGPAAWVKLLDTIHKQIGNAVPVPLAHALGKSLGKALVDQWLQAGTCNDREDCKNTVADDDSDGQSSTRHHEHSD
ncbi:hypothetical protein JB92DRAFT_2993870 [Gautieria morchelliformis]|nr:hypothetical protein JB92DRAFT_2993870 [Gautieria morchelliformis]